MDCLQAAEVLSAASDGELLDAAELAEARQHCATCPECKPIEQLLARLEAAPVPQAPPHLVARLEELAARAAAEAAEDAVASALVEPARPQHRRSWEWTPRFTALASAAAVLLIALTAGSVALLDQRPADQGTAEMADEAPLQESSATMAAPEVGAAKDAGAARSDASLAPQYVVFDGTVWVVTELPATTQLAEVGTVTSDLGTGATSDHSAYTGQTAGILYVQSDGPEMLAFKRVTRTFGGTTYALVSDVPLPLFGRWPTLPASIPQPQQADGSPGLMRIGFDDLTRDIYTLRTGSIRDGFAVAPGTPPDDPAAGNPNWTWWTPVAP
jgi:hypothetical protein